MQSAAGLGELGDSRRQILRAVDGEHVLVAMGAQAFGPRSELRLNGLDLLADPGCGG